MDRKVKISRKTNETEIMLAFDADGSGRAKINTGIGFFDHMLGLFARHGFFDVDLQAAGDLDVDCHHTVEDVGIVLGEAIKKAVGKKEGIRRYGSATIPMDETLAMCAVDLSGRSFVCFDAVFTQQRLGDMDTEMIKEFFTALGGNAEMNLHIKVFYGNNNHHIAEAIFKSFARALSEAVETDPRSKNVLSTKGEVISS
ncbi:MAG: imidazoleglycerol-phosphate dehydratase HisB [Defluviitaleaceae bacterium]|nr:imidazoleglycerol-phosphate dehydratase HisB [Defluviitaleaceae bacterium]